MSEVSEEFSTSALYRDNPEWSDIQPIYPSKDEDCAVRIACTEQFGDAFAYLRAVLISKEMSPRVLRLTEDCIQLNPANYTLWQFRRDLLKSLNIDLVEELKYLDGIIMETPKNYQVWHHRRVIVEWLGESAAKGELAFTAVVLEDESKNYHAWQHRQWVVRRFILSDVEKDGSAVDGELSFALKLILEDPRNNSAWNYRYFILQIQNKLGDVTTLDIEINLAKRFIEKMPNNESIWNYLTGLLLDVGVTSRHDVITFVEDLYDRTESSKRAAYLVSFICDINLEKIEKGINPGENCKRAKELYSELISLDPVRTNYWKHQQKVAENMLEKQTYKTVAN